MKQRPSLKTKRLILRPFTLMDAPSVQKLAGEIEIASTTLNIPHPYENGVAEAWIQTHQERFEKQESVDFAIVLHESGGLIGAIGLVISVVHSRAEMGYWIGKPFWGRGYCTEAAKAVIDYGFAKLKLHRIYAFHFSRNPASGRVLQKVGMRMEGHLRQHVLKWGAFEDLEHYGILKQDQRGVQNAECRISGRVSP
jgi:[ribosomal protein S5]-alanine N-acetyltransferase